MKLARAVDGFLDYLENERRSPRATIKHYGQDVRNLAAFAGARGVVNFADIDVPTLRAWLGSHAARSPGYRQRMIAAIRTWQRWGARRDLLDVCSAEAIASPRVPRPLPRVLLTPEDAARLVEAPDLRTIRGLRDRAILELLYGSGLRAGEIVALDCGSVDLAEQTARVLGKGGKERLCPIGGRCVEALRAWLAVRPRLPALAPAVFLSLPPRADRERSVRRPRKRISVRQVETMVQRYGAKVGRPDVHPHAIRRATATHMLDNGADVRSLQALLGHEKIATTERYTHVSLAHVEAVYAAAHPLNRGKP